MSILIRVAAAFLVAVAASVAVHFVITPIYHPGGDVPYTLWEIHNWFMGAGMIIAVIASYLEKRQMDGDGSDDLKLHLEVNTVFYALAALFLLYFWNWFSNLSPNNQADGQYWTVIDVAIPILMGVAGCRLWRRASR